MTIIPTQSRFSSPLFWGILPLLAFAVLPTFALHYGLWGSTWAERLNAMGWHSLNVSWLWFLAPLILAIFSQKFHTKLVAKWLLSAILAVFLFILISAKWANLAFGYATLALFASLIMLATNALTRLNVIQGDRFLITMMLGVVLFIFCFILYPTATVFTSMFFEENQFAPHHLWQLFQQLNVAEVVFNSFSVSATVGVLSTFFGTVLALYTARIAKKTAFIGKIFSILPIVTPPFVVGLGVILLFGRSGLVTDFLVENFGFRRNWLYGFMGIALSHTLALTPMAFMIMEGALKSLNPTLEEASFSLQASRWQTFKNVIYPLLKPALANAFLITFIQSLADFSTPFVLGGNFDVLASQIYFFIAGSQPDYTAASGLGAILLTFSLASFLLQYYWIGKRSYVTVSGKGYRFAPQPLASGLKWGVICIFSLWVMFTAVLYGSIFFGSFTVNWGVDHRLTFEHYRQLFGQGLNYGGFPSLIQTVLYALCAAPITAVLGLLIAYLTRRKQFTGRKTLEFLTLLCFAVPGTVAGVSYVLAFNNAPLYLTGTGVILVLSMVTRNMPIGMRSAIAGLEQIDKALDEASLVLTANSFQTLRFVVFPLLKRAFLSALVTSFVRSMTTISAIIFLVTPSTRVATSYILSRVEDGDYGLAIAYGSTLIVVMMAIILAFNWLIERKQISDR